MSFPKLSMREVRSHPAVITDPGDLRPGLDVVLCHLQKPVGRVERCGHALYSLVSKTEGAVATRRERMRDGFRYTPPWGIAVNSVAKVNWVNTTNELHEHPYASFMVTQSRPDNLSSDAEFSNLAASMDEVSARVLELPQVECIWGDNVAHEYELITHYDKLGLAPEPYGLYPFVIDRTKL